jgi:hypothetical protein
VLNLSLLLLGTYLLLGLIFSVPFLIVGITRLDSTVGSSPHLFRIVVLPGSIALWPVLAWKWFSRGTVSENDSL